jgi:hypothetical protein
VRDERKLQVGTKRSIHKLIHEIEYLTDELRTLRKPNRKAYEEQKLAYYKPYAEATDKWRKKKELRELRLRQEADRRESILAEHQKLRSVHLKFVERIRRDIDRALASGLEVQARKLSWQILPPGQWTLESILHHYTEMERLNPQLRFDIKRLETVLQLKPSFIYVGIGEFDGYVVLAFAQTRRVVLECPIYGNAIYVIRQVSLNG